MPGLLHCLSGKLAYDSLPPWERRLWRRQSKAIPDYCTIPDRVTYIPRGKGPLTRYVDLPNGHRPPHGPTDKDWSLPFLVSRYVRDNNRYWMTHYLKHIICSLKRGAPAQAAKYAGVLAHNLQDSAVPGHNTDNYLLMDLCPPPRGQYWHVHKIFDDDRVAKSLLKKARPRLLGRKLSEAIFHLEAAYEKMVNYSRSQAIPILENIYGGRRDAARRRLAGCMNRATELVASAWHTAFCLAFNRLEERRLTALNKVSLVSLSPELYASQYPYMTYRPGIACVKEGLEEPVRLKGVRLNADGFSVSGTSAVIYHLPKGVFRRLRTYIGVHQGKKPARCARFRVAVERQKADRIHVDLNLQTVRTPYHKGEVSLQDWTDGRYIIFDSGPVQPTEPTRRVDLRLPPCERLILLTCRVGEDFANAVWGKPSLEV